MKVDYKASNEEKINQIEKMKINTKARDAIIGMGVEKFEATQLMNDIIEWNGEGKTREEIIATITNSGLNPSIAENAYNLLSKTDAPKGKKDAKVNQTSDEKLRLSKFAKDNKMNLFAVENIYTKAFVKLCGGSTFDETKKHLVEKFNKVDVDNIVSLLEFANEKCEAVPKAEKDSDSKMTKAEKIWNVSDAVAEENIIINLNEANQLFMYEDGVYKSDGMENKIKALLAQCGNKMYDVHFVKNDLLNCIDRLQYTNPVPKEEFNKNKNILVVKNGLLNIDTGELRPHTPDEIYTSKLNFDYDKNAELPKEFQDYLKSTFKNVEHYIDVLQEIFGYCLSEEYFIHTFFLFLGDGGNGKGTSIQILEKFIGEDNTSALSLKEICSPNPFFLSGMYGKKLNVCGDIGSQMIKADENLKKISGDDAVNIQFKKENGFRTKLGAKIICAGNEMPEFDDGTKAILDRVNIIDFPNSFRNKKGEKKKIVKLSTTPEGLSGILTWALEGYRRLREQGKFSHTLTTNQKMELFNKKSNPVKSFVEDCVHKNEGGFVERTKMETSYKIYAKKNKLPSKSKKALKEEFIENCIEIGIETKFWQNTKGERKYGFKNIELKV